MDDKQEILSVMVDNKSDINDGYRPTKGFFFQQYLKIA